MQRCYNYGALHVKCEMRFQRMRVEPLTIGGSGTIRRRVAVAPLTLTAAAAENEGGGRRLEAKEGAEGVWMVPPG